MVRRNTWIMLVIFVLIGGFVFGYQRLQASKTSDVATQTPLATEEKLYAITLAGVDRITIEDQAGESITTYRDPQTINWVIDGLPYDTVDSAQIQANVTQLLDLTVKQTLAEDLTLDVVGLDTPAYTITMTSMDGSQVVTTIGNVIPSGNGYYLRVGSGPVSIVDINVIQSVVGMLKNPPWLPTPTPEVTPTETGTPVAPETPATPTP
jgi:hypothetical protein